MKLRKRSLTSQVDCRHPEVHPMAATAPASAATSGDAAAIAAPAAEEEDRKAARAACCLKRAYTSLATGRRDKAEDYGRQSAEAAAAAAAAAADADNAAAAAAAGADWHASKRARTAAAKAADALQQGCRILPKKHKADSKADSITRAGKQKQQKQQQQQQTKRAVLSKPTSIVQQRQADVTQAIINWCMYTSCDKHTLLLDPRVVEHHTKVLLPLYYKGRSSSGSNDYTVPCHCSQCHKQLPHQHVVLHVCPVNKKSNLKQLSAQDLGEIAARLQQDWQPGESCPLCNTRTAKEGVHFCRAVIWRMLVVDHSSLPAFSAAAPSAVLQEGYMKEVRQMGGVPIKIVGRVPASHLPSSISSSQQVQLLAQGVWPLFYNVVVSSPSSYVKGEGQMGLFLMHEPAQRHTYHSAESSISSEAVDAFLDACGGNSSSSSSGGGSGSSGSERKKAPGVRPIRSLQWVGFYTGAFESGPASKLPENELDHLSRVSCSSSGRHINPSHVGGFLVQINQAHGPARTLDNEECQVPTGVDTAGKLLLEDQVLLRMRVGKQLPQHPGWAEDLGGCKDSSVGEVFKMAAPGEELGWEYCATTDNPGDPLLGIDCVCHSCQGTLEGMEEVLGAHNMPPKHQLVTLKEKTKRKQKQEKRSSGRKHS